MKYTLLSCSSTFFAAWIDREAKTKRWQKLDQKRRQLDLFR
jgi:hypothetical protein